jgi:hypothetical protein
VNGQSSREYWQVIDAQPNNQMRIRRPLSVQQGVPSSYLKPALMLKENSASDSVPEIYDRHDYPAEKGAALSRLANYHPAHPHFDLDWVFASKPLEPWLTPHGGPQGRMHEFRCPPNVFSCPLLRTSVKCLRMRKRALQRERLAYQASFLEIAPEIRPDHTVKFFFERPLLDTDESLWVPSSRSISAGREHTYTGQERSLPASKVADRIVQELPSAYSIRHCAHMSVLRIDDQRQSL